jgi:hypothetical protein
MGPQGFDEPAAPTTSTVWPICFAVGVAVLLVGPRRARRRSRVVAVPRRPDPMSIHELEISWAMTAGERRRVRWELIACEEVKGVFLTARDDVLAVLYGGERRGFEELARTLAPEASETVR